MEQDIELHISEVLKEERTKKGNSQEKLAEGADWQCREGEVYRGEGPFPAWEELCGGGEPAGAGFPLSGDKGYFCE